MSIPDVLLGSTLSNFLSIFTAASATPLFTRGCGHYFILSFSCYLTNFLSCIIFSFIHRHHHINLELPYTLKLSENIIELERIFALITDATLFSEPSHHGYTRCLRLDLPWRRSRHLVPRLVPTYEPYTSTTIQENKAALFLLSAFETTYHGSITPISPDMVPLVIDTGASVTVTPYKTDFIGHIHPVQDIEIKGIASGLAVSGFGDVSYTYRNDNGELQTLLINDCLYVP
jgi:hypothetical protein